MTIDWPADVDGDVFRRLQSGGFDFGKPHKIDFQIDFNAWPPSDEAIALLTRDYAVERYEPEDDGPGYLQITVVAPLSYNFVIGIQENLSQRLSPFGGICNSWSVLS